MGGNQSTSVDKAESIPDALPELIGCDAKGTVLCPDDDESLNCLNGGVCALFLREVEDSCEKRCRCNPDYIGKYCEYYNGFFTATVTITMACLLTVILAVFIIILVWYCCSRKRRKEKESQIQQSRSAHRVPLANRISGEWHSHHSPSPARTEFGQMRIHYPTDAASSGGQTPTSSILRSYSVYDNIRPEENRFSYFEGIPIEHHPAGVIDTQETARLLSYDSTDYGVVPERTLRDNDQTPGIRQLSPQETTVLQRPNEGT